VKEGMCVLLAGVFVGVFAGALVYQVVKQSEVGQSAAKKLSDGLRAAKSAFLEGYQPKAAEGAEG